MSAGITEVTYVCDWTDEHGDVCGETDHFSGQDHATKARDGGWGWYANAYIRRVRWEQGAQLWFCPVHATVFRLNHGWGDLEAYGPPTRWWQDIFRSKPR